MSNLFSKHLHLCFFKLKYPTTTTTLSPPYIKQEDHHNQTSPQSQSQSQSQSPSPSLSPSPPNAYIFNSLYDVVTTSHSTSKSTEDSDDDDESWDPPDFAAVFSSQRFFFSTPGLSNSIIESPDTRPCNSNKDSSNTSTLVPRGGIRVPKYSLNPYEDFRRSMQEMIDSREVVDVRKDWDYLHELLLCYLALNPSHTHKFIVRAFTDLVVDLLAAPPSPPPPPPTRPTTITGGRVVSTFMSS